MSIETFEAQKKWEEILINYSNEVIDFVASRAFDLIKDNPTTANLFIRHGRAENFEQIFFSFPQHVLNNNFLALQLIESTSINFENKIYLDYLAPFFKNVLFAEQAVNNNSDVYQYLPEESKSDFYIANIALKKNGRNFKHLPENLKNLHELKVIACDNKNYSGYEFLSIRDQSKEVYYQLAKKDLLNYEFFSDFLKQKFKHLLLQRPSLLEFAPDIILNNESFLKSVIKVEPASLLWAPEKYKKDKDYCLELYKQDAKAIIGFDDTILQDKEFCLKLISNLDTKYNISLTWNKIPEVFQQDISFLKTCINKDSRILAFAPSQILNDTAFISGIQTTQANTFKNLPDSIKNNNLELIAILTLIISHQRGKNNFNFKEIKINDFIKDFKLTEPIQSYLLKQNFTTFKQLHDKLSKLILEKNLEETLGNKTEHKQKIKI